MPMNCKALIIFCTCPDEKSARRLAESLVREKLAACVNITAAVTSVYRWQGKLNSDQEALLTIKSTETAYPRLEKRLREQHPYELPEILAIPVKTGLEDYLRWVEENTCTS